MSIFICTATVTPVTFPDEVKERALNFEEHIKAHDALHPLVQSSLVKNREQTRATASR